MKNIGWKIGFVVALLLLCGWMIYPPQERIRLGKDLRGGVSLIYQVNIEPGMDRDTVINQVIRVLHDRLNPRGVLDISIARQGLERIEIVMPLPTAEVRELRQRVNELENEILNAAVINEARLIEAAEDGQVVEQFGGVPGTDRFTRLVEFQAAYTERQRAEQAYEAAKQNPDIEQVAFNRAEREYAEAMIRYGEALAAVEQTQLERNRLRSMLQESTSPQRVIADDGTPVRDPNTGEVLMRESQRAIELEDIRNEFPHIAGRLDELVEAWDEYSNKRVALDDPEDLRRMLRGAGVLEFHIAVRPDADDVNVALMREQLQERGPNATEGTTAAWFRVNDLSQFARTPADERALRADAAEYFASTRALVGAEYQDDFYLLLYTTPRKSITHDDDDNWSIQQAFQSQDDIGRPSVAFTLDSTGGQLMSALTGPHVNEPMAIVLDGEVYTAPNLQSRIGNRGQISGEFTNADVEYLIRVLAAGALEATLSPEPIAMNTLGPSIGADNLQRGLWACVYALIAVAIFMAGYYFFAGVVADVALLTNGILIFGIMSMIDGTFTLPGLAGIVLTIGMAVDANVLIYERIREELFAGETDLRIAIKLGYKKALSTIIDANVTNLIVCFVLGQTATAEVKGFAATLAIGIVATLFTSLFVTRWIYAIYTDGLKVKSLPMLPTVVPAIHRALEPSINWMKFRYIFWAMSATAIVASVILVQSRGIEMFDTEFRGGAAVTMQTGAEDGEQIWLPHVSGSHGEGVQQRVQSIGQRAVEEPLSDDPEQRRIQLVRRELARANVLTTGDTEIRDGAVYARMFQIKVANPPGLDDETILLESVVNAIVDEFGDELDIAASLDFRGEGQPDRYGQFTYPITSPSLGANIDRPTVTDSVSEFVGGVAIVIEAIDPPARLDDIDARIQRLRNQPDYETIATRRTRVIGLTPADPNDPEAGYTEIAVVVHDPQLNYNVIDPELFDRQLAATEWELVGQAMTRPPTLEQVSTFSSAVAATLAAAAAVAVVLSLLGILVYIWVRFGSLRYSLAAIIALLHDVTIALGILALAQIISHTPIAAFLLIDAFRIDMGVIAALLTIIGYSLNDTIVILDRIRENRGKLPLATSEQVNLSINQTVSRTVLTSFTTLIAVLIMYLQGGSGIRPFTFCLLVGLVIGTYSSVAIAAPLVFKDQNGSRRGGPGDGDRGDGTPTVGPAAA